jgi:hypothetical protein
MVLFRRRRARYDAAVVQMILPAVSLGRVAMVIDGWDPLGSVPVAKRHFRL